MRASPLTDLCIGTGWWPDNEWTREFNGACWTRTLHRGSNISRFSVIIFEIFLVYVYKLHYVQFSKMISSWKWFTVQGWNSASLFFSNSEHWCVVALHLTPKLKYRPLHSFRNILSIYIYTKYIWISSRKRSSCLGLEQRFYFFLEIYYNSPWSPKFKMAQSFFTKTLDIFRIYRATKARSVHGFDQHV